MPKSKSYIRLTPDNAHRYIGYDIQAKLYGEERCATILRVTPTQVVLDKKFKGHDKFEMVTRAINVIVYN